MKAKIALLFSVLSINGLAHAEQIKADCETLGLSVIVDDDAPRIVAYWQEKGEFPNPSREVAYGDSKSAIQESFLIECPKISMFYDGNELSVYGASLDEIIRRVMPSKVDPVPLYNLSGYKYKNIKQGFYSYGYGFDIKKYELISGFYTLKQGSKVDRYQPYDIKKTVIGYKIDGGEMQPLLFDGFVSEFSKNMKKASLIEIFHKADKEFFVIFRKIVIDKKTPKITFYKQAEFPEK